MHVCMHRQTLGFVSLAFVEMYQASAALIFFGLFLNLCQLVYNSASSTIIALFLHMKFLIRPQNNIYIRQDLGRNETRPIQVHGGTIWPKDTPSN
jgi:hypothetical protein